LNDSNIQTIETLILSHNDDDHVGDLQNVFVKYRKSIRRVFFLDDRLAEQNNAFKVIRANIPDSEEFDRKVFRLEARENKDVFFDEIDNIRVTVLYPSFRNNLLYRKNNTCAVIALQVGTQKIIFSGDALLEAWNTIVSNHGRQAVQILTVPHHGGGFTRNRKFESRLDWFFTNVQIKYAVVSSGYGNQYGHPNQNIIQAFAKRNIEIFCTQLNEYCSCIKENNTKCCGTIGADISQNNTDILGIEDLQKNKKQYPNRLCMIKNNKESAENL
jgi:competence protein ComEC